MFDQKTISALDYYVFMIKIRLRQYLRDLRIYRLKGGEDELKILYENDKGSIDCEYVYFKAKKPKLKDYIEWSRKIER